MLVNNIPFDPHLFLLKILRIRQFGLFAEHIIYEVLYPYCQGELLIVLSNALTMKKSFDSFHAPLLQNFITTRQLSQLRTEKYERVQLEGESLANYIQAIKDAVLVLRILGKLDLKKVSTKFWSSTRRYNLPSRSTYLR